MNRRAFVPIIDSEVRALVSKLESPEPKSPEKKDQLLQQMIHFLKQNCEREEVKLRYLEYRNNLEGTLETIGPYPLDQTRFAQAFDPVQNEEAFWNCWSKYGIVISSGAASPSLCKKTIVRIKQILGQLSDAKVSIDDPESYAHMPLDPNGTPFMSRGFFEIYHDDCLAQLRQALRVYLHHVIIWGRVDLWTSFDRIGVKLPGHHESRALPLHVDQNPIVHPDFRTVQGVLALSDCTLDQGTFVAVPGSKNFFSKYAQVVHARNDNYRGEYVELNRELHFASELAARAQAFPLREGDLISFDSRTTHANASNVSKQTRYVAYIAMGPAQANDPNITATRREAFESALGSNVRDALMHASMRPRFTDSLAANRIRTPEQLSYLGKLVYGVGDA